MRLRPELVRARRMELGLTTRAVAKAAAVSPGVIKRIETTGDVTLLQTGIVDAVLAGLALDYTEAVQPPHNSTPHPPPDAAAAIVAILLEQRRLVTLDDLAALSGTPLDDIAGLLDTADAHLRHVGLRIHRLGRSASLTAAPRPDLGSRGIHEQLRYLANLNRSDIALLYRIVNGHVALNTLSNNANATVAVCKLHGAGLIDIGTATVTPSRVLIDLIGH